MNDIREKGLEDVVLAAVPLQDHCTRTGRAILVDLAVLEIGIGRVCQAYGSVKVCSTEQRRSDYTRTTTGL